jgi:hypothetical protein
MGVAATKRQASQWRRYRLMRHIRKPTAATPTQPSPIEEEGD